MLIPAGLARQLKSSRTWIGLGILAPLGMLAVSAVMLLDLRQEAWKGAERTSWNLLQVLDRDIARNIELYDLSLQGVVEALRTPGVHEAEAAIRQLALFDRAATAKDLGVLLVLDENGDAVFDAGAVPPRILNNADRDYFQAHKAHADLGLHISRPVISKLMGDPVIVLSRRIDKPDGSFGGIVLGTLKLSYFRSLFDRIGLGREGGINLYLADGTRIARYPALAADIGANLAGTPNFDRFARERRGAFVATSVRDRVERHYAFTRVGDLPLILNVALSTMEVEAAWRSKAVVISGVVLMLCGLTIALSLLFGRELRRRGAVEAELARLALSDALTGLPNRRRFDAALSEAWEQYRGQGRPLALLIIDVDHFKRYNDRFGHQVGDEVLVGLASALRSAVEGSGGLASRHGGEEFAVLMPGADEADAARVAQRIHAEVRALSPKGASADAGAVTVSIGLASTSACSVRRSLDLYRLADEALYKAKSHGRDQTWDAQPVSSLPLRVVGASQRNWDRRR